MQNKSAVMLFTILLAAATLYILSFNLVGKRFEKTADVHGTFVADSLVQAGIITEAEFDNARIKAAREFLRDSANAEIYPVMGHTYREVKENELNLGLDLKGGMSVTLEVSISDLIVALSDYSDNPAFRAAIAEAREQQKSSNDDIVTLFGKAWSNQNSSVELWRIFHNVENKELFPAKSSDDEILDILRSEAQTAINNTENIIRKRIDQFGVAQPNVQKMSFSGRILVELPGVDDRERVRQQLKSTANLEFWETYNNDEVFSRIAQANDALGRSINPEVFEEGYKAEGDSTLTLEGDSTLTAETDSARIANMSMEERRKRAPLFSLLQIEMQRRGPVVGYALVSDTADINVLLNRSEAIEALGPNLRLLWEAKPAANAAVLYAIRDDSGKKKANLDGKSIVDARVGYDEIGDVVVNMTMNGEGASKWGAMTEVAASSGQRPIAVVLDNKVYSAPSVRNAITNGRSQISFGSGQTSTKKLEEAEDLSSLLKAGSLPAPARIVDEVSIGPQLGEDNINAGMMSFIIAFLVIMAYMIFYYKGAGLISDIALIANLFFLIGALASLGAALTLPGIAGIVLTIGMAVDANVLIYERIREEMRNGKGMNLAIKEGYQKAYSAILDANVTTLLTAVVLYAFGSGSIRGFATTLIVGIFTSLFSAIVITRLIFYTRMENKKSISFYTEITKNWFTNTKIDFVGKRKLFYGVSAVIIIAGIVSLTTRGLNQGVEFTGGTTFDISFDGDVDIEQVRSVLADAFAENGAKGNPLVQTKDSNREMRIMTNFMQESTSPSVDEEINKALEDGLAGLGVSYTLDQYNKVDSTISDDFRRGAMYATIFSLLVIFLYLLFRFRRWQYGLGALIAMVHDVLIVVALFSMFWGVLPFTMEVDQAFIAAILTVIGYSINDTVVVFDRIREYLGIYGNKRDQKDIINDALNSTLSRTINTSLTTFVVLLTIFILGGDNIKGFVFALMAGIVVGTYSSIFIATPSVIDMSKKLTTDKKA
jgi:SecD/SecF fusion protein